MFEIIINALKPLFLYVKMKCQQKPLLGILTFVTYFPPKEMERYVVTQNMSTYSQFITAISYMNTEKLHANKNSGRNFVSEIILVAIINLSCILFLRNVNSLRM